MKFQATVDMSESAKNNMLRISKCYLKSWRELNLIELIITLRFHTKCEYNVYIH